MMDNILFIEWEDSYGATSGWVSLDGYKPEGLICKSCGFLVYQDKKVVALAPNYAPPTTYTHEQANGLMVIPKTCIRRVTSFCLSPDNLAITGDDAKKFLKEKNKTKNPSEMRKEIDRVLKNYDSLKSREK